MRVWPAGSPVDAIVPFMPVDKVLDAGLYPYATTRVELVQKVQWRLHGLYPLSFMEPKWNLTFVNANDV
jgi:hypothetical protein